jgi:hypothetical protein
MLRVVDLGRQADEHRHLGAVWDTVRDRFVTFDDEQAWATRRDLERALRLSQGHDLFDVQRVLALGQSRPRGGEPACRKSTDSK